MTDTSTARRFMADDSVATYSWLRSTGIVLTDLPQQDVTITFCLDAGEIAVSRKNRFENPSLAAFPHAVPSFAISRYSLMIGTQRLDFENQFTFISLTESTC